MSAPAAGSVLDWQAVALGDLLGLSNGINADKSAYGTGVPFANVLEVITHESITESDIPGRITVSPEVQRRYEVKPGDVLFNRTSETQEEVGLASVYVGSRPIVFGGFVFRGRPLTSKVALAYSKYAFRSAFVRSQVVARGQGGIRANIGQRDLKNVTVFLPSLAEQFAIAERLDDVSALVSGLERTIAKKQAMRQGMMQHLLTGETRLPGFTAPWREARLGDHASMGSGGTPPSGMRHYYGGGIPWVSISDMTRAGKFVRSTENTLTSDGLNHSAAKLYPPGVVLYAMYASLGECAIAVDQVSSSQAILGIEPSPTLDRDFLYYRLLSMKKQVREVGQQGAQANLNAGMVRDFRIYLPTIEEQRPIASALADADAELEVLRTRLAKAHNVKQGMMQELLTGRTRLRVEEPMA